jgi:hypothetical protein
MENFSEMALRFVSEGAAIQVPSPEDAGVAWIELLRDPQRMKRMGETARRLVEESRGATGRAVAEVQELLETANVSRLSASTSGASTSGTSASGASTRGMSTPGTKANG